jgi:hypothetical protein
VDDPDNDDAEEDAELRDHLAEMQHLNDALEALISTAQRRHSRREAPVDNMKEQSPAAAKTKLPGLVTPILSNDARGRLSPRAKTRKQVSAFFTSN